LQEPNTETASFTTRTVTILLYDNDPRSVFSRALFTENPRSGGALLCDRVSSAFATKLTCWYFFSYSCALSKMSSCEANSHGLMQLPTDVLLQN